MGVAVNYSQVIDHMRRRADWLLAGQADELIADYSFPVPVELPMTRVVVRTPDEGREMVRVWHAALVKSGVVRLESNVIALDAPRGGRFRIWVEYHEVIPGRTVNNFTSVLYYCSTTATGFRIEMVSYPQLSMPELNPKFAAVALSA